MSVAVDRNVDIAETYHDTFMLWSLNAKYNAAGFTCNSVVTQLGPQQFEGHGTCTSGAQKITWTDPPGD